MADKQKLAQWEQLKTEYDKFQLELTKAETIKEQFMKQAAQVEKEIFDQYGTTDIDELRQIYKKIETEDDEKLKKFIQEFETAKQQLVQLKAILADIPNI